MGKITFLVTKGETTYDMSELVESATWSGRKGSPARTLSVSLIDDDGWKHARSGIDVTKGNHCVFYWEGAELFRGIIMRQRQSTKKTMTIKAYDVGIYLSNNKDSFCYKQKKASEIFKDCCDRFQIPYKDVADTGYVISELPKAKTTACDVILDALSLTFKATGIRHYVTSADGKLSLIKRKDSILQWVVETGRNLISYDYTCSIEKVKTRIKLLSKEDKVLAEKADTELEKTIGIMQDISTPDSNTEEANLTDMAESMLAEQKLPSKTLTIEGLGQANVISGVGLCIIIKPLGISNSYYVDEDTPTSKSSSLSGSMLARTHSRATGTTLYPRRLSARAQPENCAPAAISRRATGPASTCIRSPASRLRPGSTQRPSSSNRAKRTLTCLHRSGAAHRTRSTPAQAWLRAAERPQT